MYDLERILGAFGGGRERKTMAFAKLTPMAHQYLCKLVFEGFFTQKTAKNCLKWKKTMKLSKPKDTSWFPQKRSKIGVGKTLKTAETGRKPKTLPL
jgi:hypothetical protein